MREMSSPYLGIWKLSRMFWEFLWLMMKIEEEEEIEFCGLLKAGLIIH